MIALFIPKSPPESEGVNVNSETDAETFEKRAFG